MPPLILQAQARGCSHLGGHLEQAVGPRLPRHNGHLLGNLLDVGRAVAHGAGTRGSARLAFRVCVCVVVVRWGGVGWGGGTKGAAASRGGSRVLLQEPRPRRAMAAGQSPLRAGSRAPAPGWQAGRDRTSSPALCGMCTPPCLPTARSPAQSDRGSTERQREQRWRGPRGEGACLDHAPCASGGGPWAHKQRRRSTAGGPAGRRGAAGQRGRQWSAAHRRRTPGVGTCTQAAEQV